MRRKITLLLLSVLILFTSCDLTMKEGPKPKMYLIANGLGYQGLYGTSLENDDGHVVPLNDTRGIVYQFIELCKAAGNEYEIIWYTDDLERSGRAVNDTGRFTFTHYSSRQEGPTGPAVHIAERHGLGNELELDPSAFEEAFFSEIESMWEEAPTSNDLMLFYFSGHGIDSLSDAVEGGPALFYSSTDMLYSDGVERPTLVDFVALNYGILFRHMDEYPCRQLFIIDCCYSGASIENRSEFLPRDDNELGYTLGFLEHYQGNVRNDLYSAFLIDIVFMDSWKHTFSGTYGKPRRMVINASTYAQQSLNADAYLDEPGILNYGGFTYRLLKYLGYEITSDPQHDRAQVPYDLMGQAVTATGLMNSVFDNISFSLKEQSTPNMTRSSYDMLIWDLR